MMVRLLAVSLAVSILAPTIASAQADHAQRIASETVQRRAQIKALCTPATAGRKLPTYPPVGPTHCPRVR